MEQSPVRLSIVIASHNARIVMPTCLNALLGQMDSDLDEVIVADSSNDGTPGLIQANFPSVTLIHSAEPLNLPQLRGRGIAASHGQIVAILDPYSIVSPGWVEAVVKAHRERTNSVIGGPVDLYQENEQGLLIWAQYINEYGMFMSPVVEGEIEILPGSNITYKRSVLFDGQTPRYPEFWKTFINWSTESAGSALWLAASIHVNLWKPIPFRDFMKTRLDHGRCFAAMRGRQIPLMERSLRAISSPVLPFVFLLRWGLRYWSRERRRREFLLTIPLQLLLFSRWAYGEFLGYFFDSNQSCRNLYY